MLKSKRPPQDGAAFCVPKNRLDSGSALAKGNHPVGDDITGVDLLWAPRTPKSRRNHMPAASYRVLHELFEHHLHFTPTQADIAKFEADLAVVSPSLMKASLMELAVGRSRMPVGTGEWRAAIYAVYNRKVAEHAQLFPAFHCFETAFRSTVAVTLEDHYKIARWWGPLSVEYRGGPAASPIGVRQAVSSDRLRALRLLVKDLTDLRRLDVMSFPDGYALLELSTLGQIRRLVEAHWALFRDRFRIKGQPMAPKVFLEKFDLIENARNKVYHHQSFGGMGEVYETARELLGCIGFPLPSVHKRIAVTNCNPPPYF